MGAWQDLLWQFMALKEASSPVCWDSAGPVCNSTRKIKFVLNKEQNFMVFT